jgi:hypothetical protein
MLASCRTAQVRLVEGSDHALKAARDHLPAVLDFLDLAGAPRSGQGVITLGVLSQRSKGTLFCCIV